MQPPLSVKSVWQRLEKLLRSSAKSVCSTTSMILRLAGSITVRQVMPFRKQSGLAREWRHYCLRRSPRCRAETFIISLPRIMRSAVQASEN